MNEEKSAEKRVLRYQYRIKHDPEKEEKVFSVALDYETLGIIQDERTDLPEWTLLTFHQCPNCPLDPDGHVRCPVAKNLVEVFEFFQGFKSFDEVNVTIEALERTYVKRTPLQNVAGSLMGVYMTTSGCPILDKMRPMVQTHLPFQSMEEMLYRFVTMYLFIQFILSRNGREPDWQLKKMTDFYEEVETVNQGFSERISYIQFQDGDVSINAVNLLNITGLMAIMTIEDEDLRYWNDLVMRLWGK